MAEAGIKNSFLEELGSVVASAKTHTCIRAVLATTRDREYTLNLLKEAAVHMECCLYHYTAACRRRYCRERMTFEANGSGSPDPAELLRHIPGIRGTSIVIVEDMIPCLKDQSGDRNARAQLYLMLSGETSAESGIVIVFIEPPESESSIPSILEGHFSRIDVPIPRAEELEKIAREELASLCQRTGKPLDVNAIKKQSKKLADGLVGLTHTGARNTLRDTLAKNQMDFDTTARSLYQRKAGHLSRELSMNILDTAEAELPVGLDNLYEYIRINRQRIGSGKPDRVKGILLLGPPGTGKTMLARGVGKIVELPVIEFRISALMNSYLGETERRFEQAFAVFDAMAPVVIFVDEIEKAFGDQGGENSGGTMMRCTGRLLSWLSDSSSPNFIIATANNVRRMGEIGMTMTRRGRFDRTFLVDVPCKKARKKMLACWLQPYMENPENAAQFLSNKTEHFSGADLQGIVDDAAGRARYLDENLALHHLEQEIEQNRVRVEALYDEFNQLRDYAGLFAQPAGARETQQEGVSHVI